jgi:hypothetical protein
LNRSAGRSDHEVRRSRQARLSRRLPQGGEGKAAPKEEGGGVQNLVTGGFAQFETRIAEAMR